MKTILVVDDSQTILKAVQISMHKMNVSLINARSSAEAQTICQNQNIDLFLIDTHIGNENGFSLCQTLKSSPKFHQTPCILMGNAQLDFNVNEMHRVGAQDYVLKPFLCDELTEKVNGFLSNFAAQSTTQDEENFFTPSFIPSGTSTSPQQNTAPNNPQAYGNIDMQNQNTQAPQQTQPVQNFEHNLEQAFQSTFEQQNAIHDNANHLENNQYNISDVQTEQSNENAFSLDDYHRQNSLHDTILDDSAQSAHMNTPSNVEEPTLQISDSISEFAFNREDLNAVQADSHTQQNTYSIDNQPFNPTDLTSQNQNSYQAQQTTRADQTVEAQINAIKNPTSNNSAAVTSALAMGIPNTAISNNDSNNTPTSDQESIKQVLVQSSKSIIEKIAWEVVPEIAERLIKEEIARLSKEKL